MSPLSSRRARSPVRYMRRSPGRWRRVDPTSVAGERIRGRSDSPALHTVVHTRPVQRHAACPELPCRGEQTLEIGAEILSRMQRSDDQLRGSAFRVLSRQARERLARPDFHERELPVEKVADAVHGEEQPLHRGQRVDVFDLRNALTRSGEGGSVEMDRLQIGRAWCP